MHRKFVHYGSESLRHLHEFATCVDKIHIPPKENRLCKSCKIGKMRRKINKTLETHKQKPLALISDDLAGPFVKSIRGYEYIFCKLLIAFLGKYGHYPSCRGLIIFSRTG